MSTNKTLYLFIFIITFSACKQKSNDKFTDTFTRGTIPMAVDVNFKSIIEEELAVFQAQYLEAKVNPVYTTEGKAIEMIMFDSARIAITTRALSEKEVKYLKDRKFSPRSYKLATDGIALIVNKSNPDTLLTVVDLRRILTGKVKNWKELHPSSKLGAIKLVFDNPNSSTVRYAIDSICRGLPLSQELNAQQTNEEVIDYVSKTPNAIGVIGVNWLDNAKDTTNLSFNETIRVVSLTNQEVATPENSYKPFQAYLYYGYYPLARDIYVILNDPRGSLPTTLSSFMTSDRGQKIILKTGLVPATQPIRIVNVNSN